MCCLWPFLNCDAAKEGYRCYMPCDLWCAADQMGAWVMPITILSHEPFGPILGNGSDAFNGTFSPYQVRHSHGLRTTIFHGCALSPHQILKAHLAGIQRAGLQQLRDRLVAAMVRLFQVGLSSMLRCS